MKNVNLHIKILSDNIEIQDRLIGIVIKRFVKEEEIFNGIKKKVIRRGLKGKKISKGILSNVISEKISYVLSTKENKFDIKINQIQLYQEDNGVTLQVKIDELDIDAVLNLIIQKQKESHLKNQQADKMSSLLFATLLSLNESISQQEKCKLLQILLEWLNDNEVISNIVNTLIQEDDNIEKMLKPLNMKIGDITLEYTDEEFLNGIINEG